MKKKKQLVALIVFLSFSIGLVYFATRPYTPPMMEDKGFGVDVRMEGVFMMTIEKGVNIRAFPKVGWTDKYNISEENSFGLLEKEVKLLIPVIFFSSDDEKKGPFFGFRVEDIPEKARKLLPRGIGKDPDGIVWVSCWYSSIQQRTPDGGIDEMKVIDFIDAKFNQP